MKLTQALKTLTTKPVKSIRQLAYLCTQPYETTRRWLKNLASPERKEAFARQVLQRWAPHQDVVVIALDPTYLQGYREGILAAALIVEGRRRAIPLYWESFCWAEMEKESEGLCSRNLFQQRFVLKLKELVYPRTLVVVADREFGRRGFVVFLKKKGIYWVIRFSRRSGPPGEGEWKEVRNPKDPGDPYRLSYRLPRAGWDPVALYGRRMGIEEMFRDVKWGFGLGELLRRVRDKGVREGWIFLVFSALVFLWMVGEGWERRGLGRGLRGLLRRGYYSVVSLGRIGLGCGMRPAPGIWREIRFLYEIRGSPL